MIKSKYVALNFDPKTVTIQICFQLSQNEQWQDENLKVLLIVRNALYAFLMRLIHKYESFQSRTSFNFYTDVINQKGDKKIEKVVTFPNKRLNF